MGFEIARSAQNKSHLTRFRKKDIWIAFCLLILRKQQVSFELNHENSQEQSFGFSKIFSWALLASNCDVGDVILVTIIECWWQNPMKDSLWWCRLLKVNQKTLAFVSDKLSPIFNNCHQHFCQLPFPVNDFTFGMEGLQVEYHSLRQIEQLLPDYWIEEFGHFDIRWSFAKPQKASKIYKNSFFSRE